MSFLAILTSAFHLSDEIEAQSPIPALEAFFRRFILLPDESLYLLLALWTIGTHLHERFEFFGYLFIHSPERQSGKSRLLELLHEVAAKPTDIQVSPSPAVLFRLAVGYTHLLDEVDGWTNKDELRNVLNAGFQKGRSVTRMRESRGSYTPETFPVYAPRALAGIGTTESLFGRGQGETEA